MTVKPLDTARDALIALRGQLIAMLAAQNAVLAARVAGLEERLARLERAASRNSGNSSLPPSMDDQPGRAAPPARSRRGKGKRNPGKQPGSPGSHLAWSGNPDRTVPHFAQGACACGADLGVAASYQQVEIPEMAAKVIQHDVHEVAVPVRAGAPGVRAARRRNARDRDLRDQLAGVVRVPDGRARDPGAPLRGADRGADRG